MISLGSITGHLPNPNWKARTFSSNRFQASLKINRNLMKRGDRAADEGFVQIGRSRPGMGEASSMKHRGALYVAAASSDSEGADGLATFSLMAVFLCTAVAGCGALAFGFNLGVVNGPLAAIAQSLGFAGNATLQGLVSCAWRMACRVPGQSMHTVAALICMYHPLSPGALQVVSSLLAGAAVGSLGGSGLADSFGRRKAFLIDAIPLAAGPLLCYVAQVREFECGGRGGHDGGMCELEG
jgi:hypothetical protein